MCNFGNSIPYGWMKLDSRDGQASGLPVSSMTVGTQLTGGRQASAWNPACVRACVRVYARARLLGVGDGVH